MRMGKVARTEMNTVLCEESRVGSEVDSTANDVVHRELGTIALASRSAAEAVSIIAMISP